MKILGFYRCIVEFQSLGEYPLLCIYWCSGDGLLPKLDEAGFNARLVVSH